MFEPIHSTRFLLLPFLFMVNMVVGPNGKLFNQEDKLHQAWVDSRRAQFEKRVQAELGDCIQELNARMK